MENIHVYSVQFISILALIFKIILGVMSLLVLVKLSKALEKYLKS